MLSIYLFFLTFKILATVICAVLCFKISRLHMTPTYTYMMFFSAFSIRVVTQLQGILYTKDILGFLENYSYGIIIWSQIIECVIIILFLLGFLRKFTSLRSFYGKNTLTK